MTVHDRLVAKYNNCEFGVKTRVFETHPQRVIHYILKTPTYSKEDYMLEIMSTIDKEVANFKKEVEQMCEINALL